jgi:hypothetical protein
MRLARESREEKTQPSRAMRPPEFETTTFSDRFRQPDNL